MPAKLLIKHISDTDNICSWNKTLKRSEVLRRINDSVGISYQVSFIYNSYRINKDSRKIGSNCFKLQIAMLNIDDDGAETTVENKDVVLTLA